MRIIGGTAARHRLNVPKGYAVRPTPDLVKQAVFNSLGVRVVEALVLELFAGSGALGLECLSRGAKSVVAVEKSPRHATVIRQNLLDAGLPRESYELRTQDVFAALRQLVQARVEFDLIVADPPFGEKTAGHRSQSFSQKLLDDVDLPRLLSPEGLLLLGHAKRDAVSVPDTWHETKLLKHGDSIMRFLQKTRAA